MAKRGSPTASFPRSRLLRSPDHRYPFGVELTKAGGLLEGIGRAIMVQALLQGAKGS